MPTHPHRAGAAATVVRAHEVGLTRADTREGRKCEAMTGNWPGRSISSVTTRRGARRDAMTQHLVAAARRANAGLPAEKMPILHVHDRDDTASRPHRRAQERSPERCTGAARCVAPVARTNDGRAAATSTLAWNSSRPSWPTSASPSSSAARLRSDQQRGSERARMRATRPASGRPSVQPHMQVEATAVCGIERSSQVAAWLAGSGSSSGRGTAPGSRQSTLDMDNPGPTAHISGHRPRREAPGMSTIDSERAIERAHAPEAPPTYAQSGRVGFEGTCGARADQAESLVDNEAAPTRMTPGAGGPQSGTSGSQRRT